MTVFARKLQGLLEETGVQQKDLAQAINITEVTISRYINEARAPQVAILEKIAEFFQVSTDYLLGRETGQKNNHIEGLSLCDEIKDLSEEQKQDVLDYIRFKKKHRSL